MRSRKIRTYLTDFRKSLQDAGKAPLTVKGHMSGVKSFYKINDIQLPILAKEGRAKPLEKHKEIPTKEDLQAVLKICDLLEKAIVLVGVSSGSSSNEILNLKVKDFKKGYDHVTQVTTLELRRQKVQF